MGLIMGWGKSIYHLSPWIGHLCDVFPVLFFSCPWLQASCRSLWKAAEVIACCLVASLRPENLVWVQETPSSLLMEGQFLAPGGPGSQYGQIICLGMTVTSTDISDHHPMAVGKLCLIENVTWKQKGKHSLGGETTSDPPWMTLAPLVTRESVTQTLDFPFILSSHRDH